MKKHNIILESNVEPKDKNVLWLQGNKLKKFGKTGWEDITEGGVVTTDRIENGAVTTDKIATNAFDSTLSKSEKIAPANIVGNKITMLDEKVDALALGKFYGYFPDSMSFPTDVSIPGYAYVRLDNSYKIWNFSGESWSDSGVSIDENDVIITTDRIADGAVTTEKIATTAFDDTLSVSGKIAPADVVGEKLTELEKNLIGIPDFEKNYSLVEYSNIVIETIPEGSTILSISSIQDDSWFAFKKADDNSTSSEITIKGANGFANSRWHKANVDKFTFPLTLVGGNAKWIRTNITQSVTITFKGADGKLSVLESNVFNAIKENANKLILLTGMGASSVDAHAINVGDVYYNTTTKLLRKRITIEGDFETIDYIDGAIYTCDDNLYTWNGSDLVVASKGKLQVINERIDSVVKELNESQEQIGKIEGVGVVKEVFNLAVVAKKQNDVTSYLSDGEYGVATANASGSARGLYYNNKGTIERVDGWHDDVNHKLNEMLFNYNGQQLKFDDFWRLVDIQRRTLIRIAPCQIEQDYTIAHYTDVWDCSADSNGLYSVMKQCYDFLDALMAGYPTIITKYDPMLSSDSADAKAFSEMKAYMSSKGFDDYPIYAKGIAEGDYTIGSYTNKHILETPAYKTYIYKVSNPSLKAIADNLGLNPKKVVYIQAACHAPEFGGSIAVCNFVKYLLSGNKTATQLLMNFDFYVIPVLEGYSTLHGSYVNALGVNVNRNYPTPTWRPYSSDYGLASGDQFATNIACGMIEVVKPDVAIDTHCLTTNLTLGVARSPFKGAADSIMYAASGLIQALVTEYPEYFGASQIYPIMELGHHINDAGEGSGSTAGSYFFYKGVECYSLCEVLSMVNFYVKDDGTLGSRVNENTLYNSDTIDMSEFILRTITTALCKYRMTW